MSKLSYSSHAKLYFSIISVLVKLCVENLLLMPIAVRCKEKYSPQQVLQPIQALSLRLTCSEVSNPHRQ